MTFLAFKPLLKFECLGATPDRRHSVVRIP